MKQIQVTVPPLDGAEFVVVYFYNDFIETDKVKVIDNIPMVYTHCGWLNYGETPSWDDDLDAKFFVVED